MGLENGNYMPAFCLDLHIGDATLARLLIPIGGGEISFEVQSTEP